ncbi:universal stress protein [Thermodesulfobacteriota bacterium B35]
MNDWKRILIAVDNTPTSRKAIRYAANIIGRLEEARIHLLHIYPEPPPGYYSSGRSLDDYVEEKDREGGDIFADAVLTLQEAGITEQTITTECRMAEHRTISQTILAVQEEGRYGTIVVGKRGVSKAEEFLFGSISNALLHHGRDVAIWVVG